MFFESFFTLGALVDSVKTAAVNLKRSNELQIFKNLAGLFVVLSAVDWLSWSA